MRKRSWLALLLAAFLLSSLLFSLIGSFKTVSGVGESGIEDTDPNSWPMFHNNPAHCGFTMSTTSWPHVLLWKYTTTINDTFWTPPAVAYGIVYVGSFRGVYALNASSGALVWSYSTGGGASSSPAIADGVMYIGYAGGVDALDAYSGNRLWTFTTGKLVSYSSPTIVDGIVYFGSGDNKVYALNAHNGAVIWTYTTDSSGYSYPVSSPAVFGGVVYVGSYDYNVYALNASNGRKLWNFTTGGAVSSSPVVGGGAVYVGSFDHNVYSLDALTGNKRWSYRTGDGVYSSPSFYAGGLYIGSRDSKLYVFDAFSGTLLWSTPTTGMIDNSSPVGVNTVVDVDPVTGGLYYSGVVYVGSSDGRIYAFDPSNGNIIWSYNTFSPVLTPAIAGGILYVISCNNTLYAFGPPSMYPTPTPSPPLTPTPTLTPSPIPTVSPTASPSSTPKPTINPTPSPTLLSPSLSFDCISSTTNSGFNVEVQGTLRCNEVAISQAGIQLAYSVNAGASWQDLAYINTGDNGGFSVVWKPAASGIYLIKASWPGNSVYSGVSVANSFAVAPFGQNQDVFSVTSNSTLTSLAFDSATGKLSFGVSGSEGTTGFTQVCIPQSLVANISSLNVIVDNAAINYDAYLRGTVWIVTFTYHHSSHNVVIALGQVPTTTPTPSPTDATITSPAPTTVSVSQPTTNPTYTSSNPTADPTHQSTNTPNETQTKTPSPSQTMPELNVLIILPLLLIFTSIAILLKHRNTTNLRHNH